MQSRFKLWRPSFVVVILVLALIFAGYFLVTRAFKSAGNTQANSGVMPLAQQQNSCTAAHQNLLAQYEQDYKACLQDYQQNNNDCGIDESDTPKKKLNVLVILDSSGSMAETISGGKKMEVAKKVVSQFVSRLPQDTQIGLMVYGHKGSNSNADKGVSCRGIEMVYPFSPLNSSSFQSAVNSFDSTGWTPIADSLKLAQSTMAQFSGEENNNIIYLVTDGLETCDGDPVNAARELHGSNIKAIVNIVGLSLDNNAQRQLKEAATAGGGEFYTANSADELNKFFDDRNKRLNDSITKRDCAMKDSVANRDTALKNVTQVRDCMFGKSNKERDDMYKEVNRLRNEKQIDAACWKTIYDDTTKKWDSIYNQAKSDWDTNYHSSLDNWQTIYNTTLNNWKTEYNSILNNRPN